MCITIQLDDINAMIQSSGFPRNHEDAYQALEIITTMRNEAVANIQAAESRAQHHSLQAKFWEMEMSRAQVEYNLKQQAMGGLRGIIETSGLAIDLASIDSTNEEEELDEDELF